MSLPGLYTDPFQEYWHLVNHVTLWDVSVERQVEISGKDGAKFAELITPRDLTKCNVGQGKYVVITDENGGGINEPPLVPLRKKPVLVRPPDSGHPPLGERAVGE